MDVKFLVVGVTGLIGLCACVIVFWCRWSYRRARRQLEEMEAIDRAIERLAEEQLASGGPRPLEIDLPEEPDKDRVYPYGVPALFGPDMFRRCRRRPPLARLTPGDLRYLKEHFNIRW